MVSYVYKYKEFTNLYPAFYLPHTMRAKCLEAIQRRDCPTGSMLSGVDKAKLEKHSFLTPYADVYFNVLEAFGVPYSGYKPTQRFNLPSIGNGGNPEIRHLIARTMMDRLEGELAREQDVLPYDTLSEHFDALYSVLNDLGAPVGYHDFFWHDVKVSDLYESKKVLEKATGLCLRDPWLTLHVARVTHYLDEYDWKSKGWMKPNPVREVLTKYNSISMSLLDAWKTLPDYEDRVLIGRFVYAAFPRPDVLAWLRERLGDSFMPGVEGALSLAEDDLQGAVTEVKSKGWLSFLK